MTSKNSKKKSARARQARFGERYTTALRHVASATPTPVHSIGYTKDDLDANPLADAASEVQVMVSWFLDHFDDPANHLPYESAEGGYQWIYGEPHDAREVLEEEFPEADPDLLEEAVARIEVQGYEWVRLEDVENAITEDTDFDEDEVSDSEDKQQTSRPNGLTPLE